MQPTDNADVSMDQLVELTGVSKNTINSWIRRDLLPEGESRPDPPRADGYVVARNWWPHTVVDQVRALAATARNRGARKAVVEIGKIDHPTVQRAVKDACMGGEEPATGDDASRLTQGVLRHLHHVGWPTPQLETVARSLLVEGGAQKAVHAYAGGFAALRERPYLLVSAEGDVETATAVDVARWALPAAVFRVGDLIPKL